jgi:hypothetical protein
MPSKGKGRLTHVFDFIGPEGRLTVTNGNGVIINDARKVIYPGASGDAWWDTK